MRAEGAVVIGERLRELRRERGWSQKELAVKSRIHPSQLSAYEAGRRSASVGPLARLAVALAASVDFLLTGRKRGADSTHGSTVSGHPAPGRLSERRSV